MAERVILGKDEGRIVESSETRVLYPCLCLNRTVTLGSKAVSDNKDHLHPPGEDGPSSLLFN